MKTELIVKFKWIASHSLAGYETPHPHLWILEIALSGIPKDGKIIDMFEFREKTQSFISPLENQYLNDCAAVSPEVRAFPTCETLGSFFIKQVEDWISHSLVHENPSIQLSSIGVALCEMDGTEMGAVRLSPLPVSKN